MKHTPVYPRTGQKPFDRSGVSRRYSAVSQQFLTWLTENDLTVTGARHLAALVIDVDATRVLAFRADEGGNEAELYSLALYDAIVLGRRPHSRAYLPLW